MSTISFSVQVIFIFTVLFSVFTSNEQVTASPIKDQPLEMSDYKPYLAYARNPDFFSRLSLKQWSPVVYEQYQTPELIQKRNNAELVNHIVKNFHAIGRLEDIGK
uniref:Hemocyanin_N domain-containing protein n=1 Tax=Strongyloides stercoralis TaxID=6248 RepID=A0A0K0DYC5_STRER